MRWIQSYALGGAGSDRAFWPSGEIALEFAPLVLAAEGAVVAFQIVIIERTGNAAVIKCGSCGGGGSSRTDHYCRACHGTGHVTLVCEDEGVPIIKCGSCDGEGSSRTDHYCRACGGVGATPAFGKYRIRKAERTG